MLEAESQSECGVRTQRATVNFALRRELDASIQRRTSFVRDLVDVRNRIAGMLKEIDQLIDGKSSQE
jgi:hypothetical protein